MAGGWLNEQSRHRRANRQEPLDLAALWLAASGWMPVYSWLCATQWSHSGPLFGMASCFAWLQRTRTIPCPATIP